MVGEPRDAGTRMAIEADGRPVTEEAWAARRIGSRAGSRPSSSPP